MDEQQLKKECAIADYEREELEQALLKYSHKKRATLEESILLLSGHVPTEELKNEHIFFRASDAKLILYTQQAITKGKLSLLKHGRRDDKLDSLVSPQNFIKWYVERKVGTGSYSEVNDIVTNIYDNYETSEIYSDKEEDKRFYHYCTLQEALLWCAFRIQPPEDALYGGDRFINSLSKWSLINQGCNEEQYFKDGTTRRFELTPYPDDVIYTEGKYGKIDIKHNETEAIQAEQKDWYNDASNYTEVAKLELLINLKKGDLNSRALEVKKNCSDLILEQLEFFDNFDACTDIPLSLWLIDKIDWPLNQLRAQDCKYRNIHVNTSQLMQLFPKPIKVVSLHPEEPTQEKRKRAGRPSLKKEILKCAESRAKEGTLKDDWHEELRFLSKWVKEQGRPYEEGSLKNVYKEHIHIENLRFLMPKK